MGAIATVILMRILFDLRAMVLRFFDEAALTEFVYCSINVIYSGVLVYFVGFNNNF